MRPKRWLVRQVDPVQVIHMAQSLSISSLTATVLLGRGIGEAAQARGWLFPSSKQLHDPFELPDMERAVDRLHQAFVKRERLCVYGDYDVDGVSASSLAWLWARDFTTDVDIYIPHRQREGYGLNESALRTLASRGVSLLVTADCGTTAHREVALAKHLGIDVIVVDHHRIPGSCPNVYAFVNPYRCDSRYPFCGLCSAGLIYKLVEAYLTKYGHRSYPVENFLDLVALATIADVVPLQDENRMLVREGLKLLSEGRRCGIRALKRCVGIEGACTASLVGFRLAPVLNAAGRLAHAHLGVQLLTTPSEREAERLAYELEHFNRRRREIEQEMYEQADHLVSQQAEMPAIVVGSRQWHMGVVGIVASRLVESYHRPAIVIAFDEQGVGRGSARSVPGYDICEALTQCAEFLEGFGGHAAAAGLTIREARVAAFAEKFMEIVQMRCGAPHVDPVLEIDAYVNLADLQPPLLRELERLHPFGLGNPEPIFAVEGLTVLERKVVGDGHLKLVVRHPRSVPFESIGFRMGQWAQWVDVSTPRIDLAFIPELTHWRGFDRIQLRIKDLRIPAG
ncbi:MAG: single-stranded-DNA-specific exonuclease RecJ [Nitrospirae bacterium]|nr:MAG: single-stranded-DNA-specific exonuclease RecJ [Nitrospirota bacterium]